MNYGLHAKRHMARRPLLLAILLACLFSSAAAFGKGSDYVGSFPAVHSMVGQQVPRAMAVDSGGNIIVVGHNDTGSGPDYFVVKFKADGTGTAWDPAPFGGSGAEVATAVAVDAAGDIIVTGHAITGTDYDILTVKFSGADGSKVWEHTLDDGSANGNDYANGIAVDDSGNIYVCGQSARGTNKDDAIVIKYLPSGPTGSAPEWVELYDDATYPGNDNRFMAITAGEGGIAVTGYTSKGGTDFDIFTRKYGYDKSFVRGWRYSSTGSRDDRGAAVKMDGSGNVFVTGFFTNTSGNADIYVGKYNPASDTPVWETSYDGNGNDEPRSLSLDGGDVFIAGYTSTLSGNQDYFTARYNGSDGALVWKSVFDSGNGASDIPVGIAVDSAADGGVFVTGYTTVSTDEDILTLKYRKDSGGLLWKALWNGSANRNDRPVGIVLSSRNVCLGGISNGALGYDFMALKYDFGALNAPTELTAQAIANDAITLAWNDNSTNEERFVIQRKLGEEGTWADIATIPVPDPDLQPLGSVTYTDTGLTSDRYYYYRVRAENAANGLSYYSNERYALTKVVSYNVTPWDFRYNGIDNRDDRATAIAVAADNNPVVTGYSDMEEEGVLGEYSLDYLAIKFDRSDRTVQWKARYDSGDGGTDMAAGAVLDGTGDIIMTGTAYIAGGGDKSDEMYTVKYDTSGHSDPNTNPPFLWDHQYGTDLVIDIGKAVALAKDGSNSTVALGYGRNASGNNDVYIIKYNQNGTRPWASPIVYDSGRHDIPAAIAFDLAGNIVVTGYSFDTSGTPAGSYDWFTRKYNGVDGTLLWSDTFNSGSGDDRPNSLDIDTAGNVYVTGFAAREGGSKDIYTIKYDGATVSTKRRIWEKRHNGSANQDDWGVAVRLDPIDGQVVVGGVVTETATNYDFHLIRYNPADGDSIVWERNFDRPEFDIATAMAIDSSGYIYLAGNTRSGIGTEFDGSSDILSVVYNYDGTFLGAVRYDGTGRQDEANAIAVNFQGEAFIAGFSRNANNADYIVLKHPGGSILVPAPFNAVAQADYGKVDLTWQENTTGTAFLLERTAAPSNDLSEWVAVQTMNSGTTSHTDSGLAPGTGYCYRISASKDTKSSRKIEKCVTTRLQAPTLAPLTVDSTTQITLNWNEIAGNTGYRIERKIGAGAWAELTTKASDATSHADGGLTPGTTYYYRISTNSAAGYSLASNEPNAMTKPSAPSLSAPANVTNTQMVLGWGAVTGAASYTLQYKVSGGEYADFAGCTATGATSCTVTGLVAPNQYFFRVKATNTGGDSAWSNETNATAALAVPTLTTPIATATITTSSMVVAWTNPVVSGANVTSYTLQMKEGAGGTYGASGCPVNLTMTCTVSGLTPNRTYYFRVKATNAAGDSNWSTEASATTLLPTPTLSSATGGAAKIDLVWVAVPEATGYTIQQAACNDSTTPSTCRGADGSYPATWTNKATNVSGTSYSAASLAAGTNYRYRIVATTASNASAAGNVLHAWTNLPAPSLTVTPASSTSLTLSWDQQPGETNYAIETAAVDTGPWSELVAAHPMNNVSYTHSSLALNTQYCYRVKAYSAETSPPPAVYSTAKCMITPPDAPNLSASSTTYESSYSVMEDPAKFWPLADYWINQPVVITSGANTYTKRVAGSVNSALYSSPQFTTETINAGDSYVILHSVSGRATGYDGAYATISLTDTDKNWGVHEWMGYKIKIFDSRTAAKISLTPKDIASNGAQTVYTTTAYASPYIEVGDTYRIASFFGAATAGSTATQLVHASNTWGTATWVGYYLMMTSGANNGLARKITAKPNASTLTVDAFPAAIATGDSYLIAPAAVVGSYFGKAAAGSTASVVNDTLQWMGTNGYAGYYLWMTSGTNKDKFRKIASNTTATITVSPAFDAAVAANDTYVIAPAQQIVSYIGTAAGSPGSSATELVDTANAWHFDWSQGYYLMMTSGSNNGQIRSITAKTATSVTVSPAFSATIAATDSYIIVSSTAVYGSGKVATAIAPASTAKGTAKLTVSSGAAELESSSPGYGNNYNYELLSLQDLFPLAANFDVKFDYSMLTGAITPDASLAYLYLTSSYASVRFDFQSPATKTYNGYIYRGRLVPQDNGRSTAFSSGGTTLYDTRTMAGSATKWKNWSVDQWKDYYVQMTSGPNNQLVRKITANGAASVTIDNPFPNDPAVATGTSAAAGNTRTILVDSVATNWSVNQWQNYYLHLSSGPNAGQTLKIVGSDASSVTVEGAGFSSPIGSGDSYRIFNPSGDTYRINVIAGNAATNSSTQSGNRNTASMLIDSSDNVGTTLPPKDWGANQWQNFYLYLSSGPNIGQFRTITTNTGNTITVDPPFSYPVGSNDSYTIFDPRAAAQAVEAYWVSIYEPVTGVTEQLIFPTAEITGKMRIERSGNSLKFHTAPASGVWQLRRQLDLAAGDAFTPNLCWIYQLGRLPHTSGTAVRTKIENFQFTVPAGNPTSMSTAYWTPEVGHLFRRSSVVGTPVEVSWNKILTATLYEVERCPAADHNEPLARSAVGACTTFPLLPQSESGATIVDTSSTAGLTPGYTYRFRVRAKYNATDYTAWSAEKWITVTPPAPALVAPASGTATTTQLTPTWNNVNGDNGYNLYWKIRSGADCTAGTWSGPIALAKNVATYNHSGLTAGTFYCYQIKALGPSGTPDSALSNVVSQSTKPVAPNQPTLGSITASSMTVSWNNVTGNSGYSIDRKIGAAGTWVIGIGTVTTGVTSFVNSGLDAGTLYYYRVNATSSGGPSASSPEQSATTTPAATSVTLTVVSKDQIDLAWPVIFGATNYKVERKEGEGAYGQITNMTVAYSSAYCGEPYPTVNCPTASGVTLAYQNTGLTPGTVYCYQIKAWNSSGGDSVPSGEKCATTSALVQQNLSASAVNSQKIMLEWTPFACANCSDPDIYQIERLAGSKWVLHHTTDNGSTLTFTDTLGIDPNRRYSYRIRAVKGGDLSPYSNIATVTTPLYQSGDTTCR